MKIAAYIVIGLLALVAIGLGWLGHNVGAEADRRREGLSSQLSAHDAEVAADQQLARTIALLAPRAGKNDAGAFLNSRIGWGDNRGPLSLPPELRKKIPADFRATDPAVYSGLDFGWMAGLSSYDYWDIERNSPVENVSALDWPTVAPFPAFSDLNAWSRL